VAGEVGEANRQIDDPCQSRCPHFVATAALLLSEAIMIKSMRLQVRPQGKATRSNPSSVRSGHVLRAEGKTVEDVRVDAETSLWIFGYEFRAMVVMPDGTLVACVDGHGRQALLEEALGGATPDDFELLLCLSKARLDEVAALIGCPVDDLGHRIREILTQVQDRLGWDRCLCPVSEASRTLSNAEADLLLDEVLELPLFRLSARDLTPAKCAARARARQALLVEKGYLDADDVEPDYDEGPPPRSAGEVLH
jgi:hypothetical protein